MATAIALLAGCSPETTINDVEYGPISDNHSEAMWLLREWDSQKTRKSNRPMNLKGKNER